MEADDSLPPRAEQETGAVQNSEEKWQKQSVNPCRHFLSALQQRDVSLASVSDVPESIRRHILKAQNSMWSLLDKGRTNNGQHVFETH